MNTRQILIEIINKEPGITSGKIGSKLEKMTFDNWIAKGGIRKFMAQYPLCVIFGTPFYHYDLYDLAKEGLITVEKSQEARWSSLTRKFYHKRHYYPVSEAK